MDTTNIFINTIKEHQKLLFEQLEKFLNHGTKVALLDFPNHNNVGDNAIWLGEKAALKKVGVEVVYQCDLHGFSEKALRKNLGKEGVVLLHGGGNLGSVWPEHQRFREKIIQTLPDKTIIQLPQSVHFDNDDDKIKFGGIARAHSNFYILVRDLASFQILKQLELKVELCPDMAFAIGPVHESNTPVVDAVWLARTDHESVSYQNEEMKFSTEKLDWFHGAQGQLFSKFRTSISVRTRRLVQKLYRNSKFLRDYLWFLNTNFFDLLAQSRFNSGIKILSRGKVIITDRLHGHIISTLLGKPQILFDNHYRKIGNYLDCFTKSREAIFYIADDKSNLEDNVSMALDIVKQKKG